MPDPHPQDVLAALELGGKAAWTDVPRDELERVARIALEFVQDWRKGDFALFSLAMIDAQAIEAALVRAHEAALRARARADGEA